MTKEEINASDFIINAVNLEDARCKAALIEWENEQRRKNNKGQALLYAEKKTAERTKREMIEKAVRWLEEEMDFRDYSSGRGSYGEIKALGTYDSLDEFINDFKQAMEE